MIHPARIRELNERPVADGDYVLYWMQASQRTRFNHALEFAVERGNELKLPVIVCFGLMDDYPEANERHYWFMVEGLADVAHALKKRGIKFVVKHGQPGEVAIHYGKRAAMIVCDRGYLRHQKRWRDGVSDEAECRVVEVESDVVVPVEVTSEKEEFAARTIRPKISKHLKKFLKPLGETKVKVPSLTLKVSGDLDVGDVAGTVKKLKLDRSVGKSRRLVGGEVEAGRRRAEFADRLRKYEKQRSEPGEMATSMLSPYLHFGQVSPIEVAMKCRGSEKFIEELIVRRELAMNFVNYNPKYDSYDGLPEWARKTLAEHRRDKRPYVYSREQLERAETHDEYWNAAQQEMTKTGYMHNTMRMYWGKKILEWKTDSREAYADIIYLNNKYFIDGRDPNAWTNVGWIFGLHDRPWGEREIFGTVRYMNAAGLKRKFDMEKYIAKVNEL